MFKFLFIILFTGLNLVADPDHDAERVCGKWVSTEKSLIVQVFKDGNEFKAKVLWFKNEDNSKTMDEWTDKHNPDPALRDRKLIGMSILRNLKYHAKSGTWEDGKIYDAKGGREWDASAAIDKNGELKVIGYWHFKFIGKTMAFTRVP